MAPTLTSKSCVDVASGMVMEPKAVQEVAVGVKIAKCIVITILEREKMAEKVYSSMYTLMNLKSSMARQSVCVCITTLKVQKDLKMILR